jgi:hypothetical protein
MFRDGWRRLRHGWPVSPSTKPIEASVQITPKEWWRRRHDAKGGMPMDWETRQNELESQRDEALAVRLRLQPGPGSKPADFMHFKDAVRAHERAKQQMSDFLATRLKLGRDRQA